MTATIKYEQFSGQLVMLGFGSIGQAIMPLLFRHLEIVSQQIIILAADADGVAIAQEYGVEFKQQRLTENNYISILEPLLTTGNFLLNLSVDISSHALIQLCRSHESLYLDTCIEPWAGAYIDPSRPLSERTNYALREEVLGLTQDAHKNQPTALVAHGANPGLVSSFVKQALINIATDNGVLEAKPETRHDWATLAQKLEIKVIHIAERDTQNTVQPKQRNEFVNTWSVAGFMSEGLQPSELGWGSHERHWPSDAQRHTAGCDAAIYLNRPGASMRVRSWTPLEGSFHGFLITHGESISIADYLTVSKNNQLSYRPTVHYAYHPCDDAVLSLHEMAGKNWHEQTSHHIILQEVTDGMDELGVLLMGHDKGVYWYGSRLTIQQARQLAPHNNATSLQVVAGILAGMIWALRNPVAGIVEPDDIDHELVLEIAAPYLGDMVGIYDDWTPLNDREQLFTEDLDRDDPWQFKNFRVE